jgi:hypothetical protein
MKNHVLMPIVANSPPVPIPNTAVKTASADGSRTARSRESRTAPGLNESPTAAMRADFLVSPAYFAGIVKHSELGI